MQTLIFNATLVLPDRLVENGWLLVEGERIAGLGESATCPVRVDGNRIDAQGNFLLPGLIDLHCDAVEKVVEPRPLVQIDLPVALHELDRRLAACGITTEYHAVSLDENDIGVRSVTFVRDLAEAIKDEADHLVRHRIHARFEVTSERGFEAVQEMISSRQVQMVSLMDHTPGQGQYVDVKAYRAYVKRTVHLNEEEIDAHIARKNSHRHFVPERVEVVARMTREAGMALATHDDDSAEKVSEWPQLGVTMCEFPTTMEAASTAHRLGLEVCMGAPNVLRGKSSTGNLSAMEAIKSGNASVLCSDYYPTAMLAAVFKLAQEQILDLSQATKLVTLNPAHAIGAGNNFGSLECGKVADLVLVKQYKHPRVQRMFLEGQERLVHL